MGAGHHNNMHVEAFVGTVADVVISKTMPSISGSWSRGRPSKRLTAVDPNVTETDASATVSTLQSADASSLSSSLGVSIESTTAPLTSKVSASCFERRCGER